MPCSKYNENDTECIYNCSNSLIILNKSIIIVHVSTKQNQGAKNIHYIQKYWLLNVETQSCSTLKGFTRCYMAHTTATATQENQGEPILFTNESTLHALHIGPTAFRLIRRTKQRLQSVFLKDTSVMAGDSNTHSADQKRCFY